MKEVDFVALQTLYSSKDDVNLDFLSSKYDDIESLGNVVDLLLDKNLSRDDIRNKRVLIKPNWVKESIAPYDPICLRTHENLLLCVVRNIVKMMPTKILVADAPIQECNWDKMLSNELISELGQISQSHKIPIEVKDLRRVKTDFSKNESQRDCSNIENYLIFDLGSKSNLEPITSSKKSFRVTNYDPDKMAAVHKKGVHKYCIAKEVFDYDFIITIPKIKTHRMAGLTCSLKILVGINGDKEYLPHHRIGAKSVGGDCYKGFNPLRSFAEYLADAANRHIGRKAYPILRKMASLSWLLSIPGKKRFMNAGWYGNDTIWRTVLDLNHVAIYGRKDGTISDLPQRKLITICDGIICGQGDGPLHPKPLPLGIISISNNPYFMDIVAGRLLGLDVEKIPLVNAAIHILGDAPKELTLNGKNISMNDLNKYSVKAEMPPGWVDYNKE